MKELKTQKGITLVALIITIVVLLILAAVAIGAVKDSDIIGYSKNAAGSFNQAKDNEILLLESYKNEIEDKLPKLEEIVWGEYQGVLFYIGTSKNLKVTSDTILVQEIIVDEDAMQYTRIEGKIKTATFADYGFITFFLIPDIETIDFGNKLSTGCKVECSSDKLIEISGLEGLKTIQEGAFQNCENIKELIIPEGVVTIEPQAFNCCDNLMKIILPSTLKNISYMNFHSSDATVIRPPMEITINMTREEAETTIGTAWILDYVEKIIYTDQEVVLK